MGKHNELEVLLDAKQDWKNQLGLSYYNNSMLQLNVMDSCVGYLLAKHAENLELIS